MTSHPDDPVELLRFGDENNPIVISLNRFRGMRLIDIRRYYFDKTSKSTKPTPKGIALKEDEFGAVANFLVSNKDSLQELFTSNLDVNELTFRGVTLEKKARKKTSKISAPASYVVTSWPAMEFFSIDESGDCPAVNFNRKIKLISEIERTAPNLFNHLKDIIIAYNTARNSLHFKNKQAPSDILEFIELEWARNLNVL